jgi:hypothetical protein
MGAAILQCLGDEAFGERSAGAAAQDPRTYCPTYGAHRAKLPARGFDQSDRRERLQRD